MRAHIISMASSCMLVAFSTLAFAQRPQDVECKSTETQAECHARLKCKANEELDDCKKRLLKCKSGESLDDCKYRETTQGGGGQPANGNQNGQNGGNQQNNGGNQR